MYSCILTCSRRWRKNLLQLCVVYIYSCILTCSSSLYVQLYSDLLQALKKESFIAPCFLVVVFFFVCTTVFRPTPGFEERISHSSVFFLGTTVFRPTPGFEERIFHSSVFFVRTTVFRPTPGFEERIFHSSVLFAKVNLNFCVRSAILDGAPTETSMQLLTLIVRPLDQIALASLMPYAVSQRSAC